MSEPPKLPTARLLLWLGVTVVFLVLCFHHFHPHLSSLLQLCTRGIEAAGIWAPILAILLLGIWGTLCLPGPVMVAVVLTIFHSQPLTGLMCVWLGDGVGQVLGFVIARRLARERVRAWIGKKSWFVWLERESQERGATGVFFIRLTPFFPNALGTYAFGLTSLKFWPYIFASLAGSLPNIAVFVGGTHGILYAFKHAGSFVHLGLVRSLLIVLGAVGVSVALQKWVRRRLILKGTSPSV